MWGFLMLHESKKGDLSTFRKSFLPGRPPHKSRSLYEENLIFAAFSSYLEKRGTLGNPGWILQRYAGSFSGGQ